MGDVLRVGMRPDCKARLYSLAEGELVFLLLAALAARLRREPLEFAVERV